MPTPPIPADGPKTPAGLSFSARRRGSATQWDRRIAWIAERQHGLISLSQLRSLGIDQTTAQMRAAAGSLHKVHRGVYAVGYLRLDTNGRKMAAVLACGADALLSHRSAADLWGIRDDNRPVIDVTAPNRRGRIPRGIDAHRDGSITEVDRAVRRGIPCTSLARTLLDLAAVLPVWELRKAVSEAEVLGLLDHDVLRSLIKRSRGRRGVARLRMVLDEIHPETRRTHSEMERRFLRICERAGLPQPEVNISLDVGGRRFRPDFLWRDVNLIVEADGRRYHSTDAAFQRDRRRDQQLLLAGWRVVRCTWEQIENEPRDLTQTIRALLAQ